MVKSKSGIYQFSNGYNTYYFIDRDYHAYKLGIRLEDISILEAAASLVIDDSTGMPNKVRWRGVDSFLRLSGKVKEIKWERGSR